jgi:hypothetical protein
MACPGFTRVYVSRVFQVSRSLRSVRLFPVDQNAVIEGPG